MATEDPEAVLVSGPYGSGKTSAIEEMAALLEERDAPFAAIDLDWLAWGNVGDSHGDGGDRMVFANLAPMVANYRAAGIRQFLLAGMLRTRTQLDGLRAAVGMPLRVVRLDVPIDEIERRLRPHPTSGRARDLSAARDQVAGGVGIGLEDARIDGNRPVGAIAADILEWLGWR